MDQQGHKSNVFARRKTVAFRMDTNGFAVEIRKLLVSKYYRVLEDNLRPLLRSRISPNTITICALVLSLISAFFFSRGMIMAGGIFLFIAGILDTIDGLIARLKGQTSLYGALLDSTLDRYSEFFIFFGLLIYFRDDWIFSVIMLGLLGSVMVSYIKARAQSLGQTRTVGLMQRPERFAIIIFGALLNAPVSLLLPDYPDSIFKFFLILLAVLTNFTALKRLFEGKADLDQEKIT